MRRLYVRIATELIPHAAWARSTDRTSGISNRNEAANNPHPGHPDTIPRFKSAADPKQAIK